MTTPDQHFNHLVLDERRPALAFVVEDDSDPSASQACLSPLTPRET